LRTFFGCRKRSRIVMECTNSTPWVYRLLRDLGHDVLVLDPRESRLNAESMLKCDKVDAEMLALLSRFDSEMLHRGVPVPAQRRPLQGQGGRRSTSAATPPRSCARD
jgi:transposase